MKKILTENFFEQRTLRVAKKLLGKFVVRKIGKKEIAGMVTEVEAYDGFDDKASHASRGKTKRNNIMFGRAGVWYVYLVYGMHDMLNVVTREKNYPAAVLIRAIKIKGIPYDRTNGPAKLTKFLKINRNFNGRTASYKTGLWMEGHDVYPKKILRGKRIGINYAGAWKHKLRRFYIRPTD